MILPAGFSEFVRSRPIVIVRVGFFYSFASAIVSSFRGLAKDALAVAFVFDLGDDRLLNDTLDAIAPAKQSGQRDGYYLFVRGRPVAFHSGHVDNSPRNRLQETILHLAEENDFGASAIRAIRNQGTCELLRIFVTAVVSIAKRTARHDDACAFLGVSPAATDADVRAAYLSKIQQFHPDRFQEAEVRVRDAASRMAADTVAAMTAIREARAVS